jgi:proteasome lid subunit RPN8/RPN11
VSLDYFWQNIQTALLHMHVLQDGDLYVSRITVRDDDQVDFSREEVQNVAPEETLIELVEVESSEPDFPQRSPAHFDVVEVKNVESVSPVELGQPDTARQDDVQIFIAQDTLEALQGIARQAVQVEQGGVLVGQVYRQPEASERYLVEIAGHIVAEGTSANVAEFRYNFDSWLRQSELLKERFPGQQIVGWYHTHLVTVAIQPDEPSQELQTTELFFSDHDRFMHRRFFSDQWYVAMVLNPQGNAAFFRWFDDKISSNQRFYVFRPEHPARERP